MRETMTSHWHCASKFSRNPCAPGSPNSTPAMISRRDFLLAAAPLAVAESFQAPPKSPPNILIILADDLGWGDLRCYNPESAIPTPNLDRLASEGVRFTDLHTPSSVCTPTRYSLLTGRYCWRSRLKKGVLDGTSPALLEDGRLTLASMLKSRGYETAGIGKWHLGLGREPSTDYSRPLRPGPVDAGFDSYFGIPASLDMPPYLYFENDRVVEAATARTPGSDSPRGVFWRPGPIAPGFRIEQVLSTFASRAVDFLRKNHTRPWFLYLPLSAPHTPWVPLPQYAGRSRAGLYGDFVAMTDDLIGKVLEAVQERNTLVIFTSDNGADWRPEDQAAYGHRANGPLRGRKADIWEAGHRVPFLARWPGVIPAGAVSSQLGCLTDLMATFAAITGYRLGAHEGEDSTNLLSSLLGTAKRPLRRTIVHHSFDGMFSIRQDQWKLVMGLGSGGFTAPARVSPRPGDPQGQLYNLEADPGETVNLYDKHPERVRQLSMLLERFQRQGHSREPAG